MKHKLSVVVSCFNEEKKIQKCLESVKWADEIILVDNSSTDQTVEIAKKFTNKIFTQENDPLRIDIQKNKGFEKADGDYILNIDADEEIEPELKKEIEDLLDRQELADGYLIPRINYIFGKRIENAGWFPDYQLRLFKRGKGKYRSETVHEGIKVEGEIGTLTGHILHQNYETVSQFIHKNMVIYARNQANTLIKDNYYLKPGDLISIPFKEFLSRYFARSGYKDGIHGLFLSLLMAASHLVVLAYVWEESGFKEQDSKTVLDDLGREGKVMQKEIKYWIGKTRVDEAKNKFGKLSLKLRNKFQ